MNRRMDRSKLNIGTYILQPYARSEEHIRDLRASGIDFVIGIDMDRPTLDLMHKYGVGAIVNGVVPGWWGGDGERAGQLEATNPMEKYLEASKTFADHPAVWAIDVGDEPSALDFPYYGRVMDTVNRKFENQFPYLNLYPNYASVAQNNATETVNQLGTATYAEHIAKYCQNVPMDYICYDFYLYSINVTKAYENLRIVSDAASSTGRDMWIVLQVNSVRPEVWMSENNLRFQAYSAMCFGARNIIWACYTAGWWHNQVLDDRGEKTEQYEKLKKINAEIKALAPVYDSFRRVATHFVGFGENHPDLAEVEAKPIESLDTGVFMGVREESGAPLVVGQMVSGNADGAYALMVCAADDPADTNPQSRKIIFRADNRCVEAWGGEGRIPVERTADGSYAVGVKSNGGVIIAVR